jgi:hypothetical protein
MPVGTGLAIGLGAAGLLGGIAGGQDQNVYQSKNVAPPTQKELELQQNSFNNYLQQQALADQQQQSLYNPSYQNLQQGSVNQLSNIIGGQSFNATPEEQAQIAAIRNASIQAGQGDIQQFLNQNLSQIQASAADRGVRGQALSQLQVGALDTGARQYGNLVNQANLQSSQQQLALPYQRAQLQGSLANQNSTYLDNLRQNAINNRQLLQNPALMGTLQNERFGTASTTQTTPGTFGGAVGGVLGGAGSLLGAAGSFNRASDLRNNG